MVDVPAPTTTPPNSPYTSIATRSRSASVQDSSIHVNCDDDDDDDYDSKTTHESFSEVDDRTQTMIDGDDQNYSNSYENEDKENWIGKVKSASSKMSKFVFNGLWKQWNTVGDYQI